MFRLWPLSLLLLLGIGVQSQQQPQNWNELLREHKYKEASGICENLIESKDSARVVEGHKCFSNVILWQGERGVQIEGNDAGGGMLSNSYKPEAIDEAVSHLNAALKLAPQDLSLHQGRLHLLHISYRFNDMVKAMDESCTTYKGPEVPDAWIAYTYELGEERQLNAALKLLDVLDKYFPDNHEIIGNMGAMHSMLKNDEQALKYLKRAVELAPDDPMDAWNLGRAYDYTNQDDLAEQWYRKSIGMEKDSERLAHSRCVYSEFVEKKRGNLKAACELQTTNCPEDLRTACSTPKTK